MDVQDVVINGYPFLFFKLKVIDYNTNRHAHTHTHTDCFIKIMPMFVREQGGE